SKRAGEMHCLTFTQAHGVCTVRLRFFNVFGPGQPENSRYCDGLATLLTAMLQGRRPVIPGDGRDCQDLLYVDDAVNAALLAATGERVSGRVYNVGGGCAATTLEVVNSVNMILGTELFPIFIPQRRRAGLDLLATIERAQAELGFCPAIPLAQGLTRCLDC